MGKIFIDYFVYFFLLSRIFHDRPCRSLRFADFHANQLFIRTQHAQLDAEFHFHFHLKARNGCN